MKTESNIDKWLGPNNSGPNPASYGDRLTYSMALIWLHDMELIEDWGCGRGWMGMLTEPMRYQGVDGSPSPACSIKADLVSYRSSVPSIFMRHVLEHNWEWEKILRNALASAKKRMCLVLFTPWSDGPTKNIAQPGEVMVDVPDLSFNPADLTQMIIDAGWNYRLQENIKTRTQYGVEHVFFMWRDGDQPGQFEKEAGENLFGQIE